VDARQVEPAVDGEIDRLERRELCKIRQGASRVEPGAVEDGDPERFGVLDEVAARMLRQETPGIGPQRGGPCLVLRGESGRQILPFA
jgi:hypothetical protein